MLCWVLPPSSAGSLRDSPATPSSDPKSEPPPQLPLSPGCATGPQPPPAHRRPGPTAAARRGQAARIERVERPRSPRGRRTLCDASYRKTRCQRGCCRASGRIPAGSRGTGRR
jgi:hypothetical protein